MNKMQVNWALFMPSLVRMLAPEGLPHLQTLVVGGEAVDAHIFETWASKLCLIEAYGPAESCVIAMVAVNVRPSDSPALIGRATSGTCWIVDEHDHDRLASLGSVGELLIEAPTLARGYLKDPDKTSKAFIENPRWATTPGASRRMYKTGDLAKYNSDGTMDFIGRKDTQVKLRGQRIELTLIEHHLRNELPDIIHLAVEPINIADDKAQLLAAFMTFDRPVQDLDLSEDLRDVLLKAQNNLSKRIPNHMVPSIFLPLATIPRSVAGKIDRRSLRQRGAHLSRQQVATLSLTATDKRPASTESEKTLQQLWANLLRVPAESIGMDDNFYQLGGDSILAMRLATLAREQDIDLTVQTILKSLKLSEMALAARPVEANEEMEMESFALVNGYDMFLEKLRNQYDTDPALIEDAYECTPLQEGLLALSAKSPGTYVAQSVFKLHPFLDLDRFKDCWEALVCRHGILRTVVAEFDGKLLQLIRKPSSIHWLSHGRLDQYLDEDRDCPLDTMRELARYCIVVDNAGQSFFVWTMHHAIYDGWSLNILLSELRHLYDGKNALAPVQPFSKIFRYIDGLDSDSSAEYWRNQLLGKDHSIFPDTDLSPEHNLADAAITHPITISRPHSSTITLPTLIRSAWAIVLASYGSSEDVIFGETFSGRDIPVPRVGNITGPLITTVPISVSLDRCQRVSEFLRHMQAQTVDMIPHQHFGLQNIRQLDPACSKACNFKTLLVVQPVTTKTEDSALWEAENSAVDHGGFLDYPLVIEGTLTSSGVCLTIWHSSSILSTEQVERMAYQFEHVLRQLNKETTVGTLADIEVLSPRDKQALSSWNGHELPTLSSTVHSMISGRLGSKAEANAIESKNTTLTYSQLDELSNKLAHHLKTLGVAPGDRVPVLFRKSVWMVVAAMAVLRVGGAYIPLDPSFPKSRNEYILKEVSAKLLLVGEDCEGITGSTVQELAVDESICEALPAVDTLATHGTPTDAACIIFTSGTTGQPKGVILSHASICSSARSFVSNMQLNSQSRVLQFAGYVFDASILEIWATLMCGGTVCVPEESDRLNRFAETINEMDVNWMFLTPTVASMLNPSNVPSLQTLVLGGEKLTKELIRVWSTRLTLINGYGPAECSIFTTFNGPLSPFSSPEHLGHHLANRLWIVHPNDHNRLTPLGGIGELLVEGPGVSDGYINDAEKSAAVFVEPPSWREDMKLPGSTHRMYKTGDLVRYDSDGSIHIIGRKDTQIKIHGQRVELGEIEAVLMDSLPRDWVGIVGVSNLGGKERDGRLTAFLVNGMDEGDAIDARLVVWTEETRALASTLRRKLDAALPSYMVPSEFLLIKNLPLTPGGKVDRQKLFMIGNLVHPEHLLLREEVFQAPSTKNEKMLQRIWASILGVGEEDIGTNSSFMHLGADSIAAMRLAQAVRATGHSLGVPEIFGSPLLSDMAGLVRFEPKKLQNGTKHQGISLEGLDLIDIPATDVEKAHLATDYQAYTLGSGYLRTRGYTNYMIYEIEGRMDGAGLIRACQKLVDQHEILRTVFIVHNRQLVQIVLRHMQARIDYRSPADPPSLIREDMNEAVQLGTSPVKFIIAQHTVDKCSLMLRISHAQYDGISLPILLNDLQAAYAGRKLSDSRPFSSFIENDNDQLHHSNDAKQYWQGRLAGAHMTNIVTHNGPSHRNVMDSSKLRTVYPQMQPQPAAANIHTFATVLQSAWALVLAALSGREDVVFGFITSGRNTLAGKTTTVGPCLNIQPLRIAVPASPLLVDAAQELLAQVQSQYLLSIPFERYGFRHIIERCTDWPGWTRFSSIVQHNNLSGWTSQSAKKEQSDGTIWNFKSYAPPHDAADVWVSSESDKAGGFLIELSYSERAVTHEVATHMLDLLCHYIDVLTSGSTATSPTTHPILPLMQKLPTSRDSSCIAALNLSPNELVDMAWRKALGPMGPGNDTPFYNIWGDAALAAACISAYYCGQGLNITSEHILDRPTKRQQKHMLGGSA
jgi:amino acid adenylation domain-containing protein